VHLLFLGSELLVLAGPVLLEGGALVLLEGGPVLIVVEICLGVDGFKEGFLAVFVFVELLLGHMDAVLGAHVEVVHVVGALQVAPRALR